MALNDSIARVVVLKIFVKSDFPSQTCFYIYIFSVVALDETNISGCLHFSIQNIEMSVR